MKKMYNYSNRHWKDQVPNIEKNGYVLLATPLSKLIISKYFKKYGIDEKDLNLSYYTLDQLLDGEMDYMKGQFDYIVGNPPYQIQVGPNKTKQIWAELSVKFFELLKGGAKMSLIHPTGWRFLTPKSGEFVKKLNNIYTTNKIEYMEFNDLKKGTETFGVATEYDVITVKKESSNGDVVIKTISDGEYKTNIKDKLVIPTDGFEIFDKLIATNSTKVNFITDSTYHTQRDFINENKTGDYIYPVVQYNPEGGLKLVYSNTDNGHFGISKLILVKASPYALLDMNGEYGLSQFAACIIDTDENLVKMQKALESDQFKRLKNIFIGTGTSNKNAIVDARGHFFKFLKEFKKDFWKEFYTQEMEQELIKEGKLNSDGSFNKLWKK